MIRELDLKDIEEVAQIHSQELSGFLPEMGLEFLSEFYKTGLELPEIFTYIAEENGVICGFVCNIIEAGGLYKRILLRSPVKFLLLFMRYIFTHPGTTGKIIKILSYPGFSDGGAELLSFAVSEKFQRKGIGENLFLKSVAGFKQKGINKFKISVYDRLSANSFYRKMGCRLISSFEFLGEKMNYYEYRI